MCGQDALGLVLCLGRVPLANDFRPPDAEPSPTYPLHFMVCRSCSTAQNSETVDPALLFGGDYPYLSSVNVPFVGHVGRLCERLIGELALGPTDTVMEIGSNDGYLLQHYAEKGIKTMGVDPACNMGQLAKDKGVRTFCGFFDSATVGELWAFHGKVRVLHANNVLAHVPDVLGVLRGVETMLAPDGVFVIETPWLNAMTKSGLADTIYHEHVYVWSVTALSIALRRAGLTVWDVEHLDTHGGSVRLYAGRSGATGQASDELKLTLLEERKQGIGLLGMAGYAESVQQNMNDLRALLLERLERGRTLAAYGAAAKGTMLLHQLGDLADGISWVADATPNKQGMVMPGTSIPIVPPSVINDDPVDDLLLTAWNFADALIAGAPQHAERGGAWITPASPARLLL